MAKNNALAQYKAGLRAARKGRRGGRKGFTLPLAVIAGFVPLGISLYNARDTGVAGIMSTLTKRLTGYNPADATWKLSEMKCGTFAILGGLAVHWLAGKFGVNRALARTGIPIVRI